MCSFHLTSSSGGGGGAGRMDLSIFRLAALARPAACFDFFPMIIYFEMNMNLFERPLGFL